LPLWLLSRFGHLGYVGEGRSADGCSFYPAAVAGSVDEGGDVNDQDRIPAADVDYTAAITVAMVLVAYQLTVGIRP